MLLFLPFLLLTLNPENPHHSRRWQQHHHQEQTQLVDQQKFWDRLLERFSPSNDKNKFLHVQPSPACDGTLGIFARSDIPPNQLLMEIPVRDCVTINTDVVCGRSPKMHAVLDEYLVSEGGPDAPPLATSGSVTKEGIVVATILLLLHRDIVNMKKNMDGNSFDHPALLYQYVASLPWNTMNSPLLDSNRPNPGKVWRSVRIEAAAVMDLLQRGDTSGLIKSVSFDDCLKSVALVRSRAFQLSKSLEGQVHCAMVPFMDLSNHPSQAALSFYGDETFLQTPISQATIAWSVVTNYNREEAGHKGDTITPDTFSSPSSSMSATPPSSTEFVIQVHSPTGMTVSKGAEVWNWYGDGGYVSDPERRIQGIRWDSEAQEAFVEIYGFDPWAKP
jgi:hypothetical protein